MGVPAMGGARCTAPARLFTFGGHMETKLETFNSLMKLFGYAPPAPNVGNHGPRRATETEAEREIREAREKLESAK